MANENPRSIEDVSWNGGETSKAELVDVSAEFPNSKEKVVFTYPPEGHEVNVRIGNADTMIDFNGKDLPDFMLQDLGTTPGELSRIIKESAPKPVEE